METHVLGLLTATQDPASGPRNAAETELKQLYSDPSFPQALINIALHDQVATNNRQAALNVLNLLVKASWSQELQEFEGSGLVAAGAKGIIRDGLIHLVLNDNIDSKVTNGAALVISKIAQVDYPEQWPGLLTDILGKVSSANNAQTQAILTVLSTLIETGGIDEEAFQDIYGQILSTLHGITVSDAQRPQTRAYALRVFGHCFDSIWLIKGNDKPKARYMTQQALEMFWPFFLQVFKAPMPALPTKEQEDKVEKEATEWRDMVQLKTQVVKALGRILEDFRSLFKSSATMLFEIVFKCLEDHAEPYTLLYVDTDERQSKSQDAHNLPCTFDLLVLEEIDYLAALLLAPELKRQLSTALLNNRTWTNQIMSILVTYVAVTAEDEGMWALDINIFLQGETSIVSNSYIARDAIATKLATACVEEKPKEFLSAAVDLMCAIFGREESSWKQKEGILFLIQTMVDHLYHEKNMILPEIAYASIDCIRSAFTTEDDMLRARAYRVAATVLTCSGPNFHDMAAQVAVQTLDTCANDDSELIQAMCIRATLDYNRYVPQPAVFEIQAKATAAISKLLDAQDLEEFTDEAEYLSDTLLEALRDAITAAPRASLQCDALPVLFKLLRYSPYNTATVDLALGAFQSIVQEISRAGKDDYFGLCIHLLPTLMEALDVAIAEDHEAFGECILTMLEYLAQHTPLGLPQEFITIVMPKLCRIIFMEGTDASFLHQRATSVIQLMISHESALVFAWKDPEIGKSGFEMTTLIIERLLGPQTEDVSAAEVGSLAVELVSKADFHTVSPLIPNLLSVSAQRLLQTQHDPLIQSLSLLFAHIALLDTRTVLDFLASIQPLGPQHGSGLETVLTKWVESSINFAGSDAIKTNVLALANIYKLHDPRLGTIRVHGDLVVVAAAPGTASRIKTRSAARAEPDHYELVSLQLKILKVLVAELPPDLSPLRAPPSAQAMQQALLASPTKSTHRAGSGPDDDDGDDDDDADDDWSDASDDSFSSAARTAAAAAAHHSHRHSFNFEGFGGAAFFAGGARDYDSVVLNVLLDFFVGVSGDPGFQAQVRELNEGEGARLRALDGLARAKQGFELKG